VADVIKSPIPVPNVKRLEFYLAVLLMAGFFIGLWWHEHNTAVAQQALLAEHEKTFKAQAAQAQTQIESLQKQVADQEKRAAAQEQLNQQLLQTMQTLNTQLSSIRAQEAQQVQRVQSMSVDELAKAVAVQLNLATTSYNQATQTLSGVTPDTLKKIETQTVELGGCKAENQNLSAQVDNANKILASSDLLKKSMQATIDALGQQLDLTKKTDQAQISLLQEQLKVKKGSFLHRVWDKTKAPIGFVAGIAIGRILR
jgi:hypothetical protein